MVKDTVESGKQTSVTSLFFSMGIDMSWRLALSVLVPVIGGVELDKHLKTSPALLFVGLGVAIVLSIITIRRTMKLSNELASKMKFPAAKPQVKDEDDDE